MCARAPLYLRLFLRVPSRGPIAAPPSHHRRTTTRDTSTFSASVPRPSTTPVHRSIGNLGGSIVKWHCRPARSSSSGPLRFSTATVFPVSPFQCPQTGDRAKNANAQKNRPPTENSLINNSTGKNRGGPAPTPCHSLSCFYTTPSFRPPEESFVFIANFRAHAVSSKTSRTNPYLLRGPGQNIFRRPHKTPIAPLFNPFC